MARLPYKDEQNKIQNKSYTVAFNNHKRFNIQKIMIMHILCLYLFY